MALDTTHWVLTIAAHAGPNIVHRVTGAITDVGGDITELKAFHSFETNRFIMRLQIRSTTDRRLFEAAMVPLMEALDATWTLDYVGRPRRTLILVSKGGHCLQDLLFRQRSGYLPIDVPLVLSNHPTLRHLAEFYEVPFETLAVTPETKSAFEDRMREVIREHDIEVVILARYMQVLSEELCAELAGRAINIHHSFLPGFKGANPYRQAHARGVKLIGATAHFVTSDLDEGPIIEQEVRRVDHSMEVPTLVELGQDQEARTLREAVKLFAEHRVVLDGHRTVVFK